MKTVINIIENDYDVTDEKMLSRVLAQITHHIAGAKTIDIHVGQRVPANAPEYKHPGWLEWVIQIEYRCGRGITIAAIQRTVGAEIEFHS